VDDESLDLVLCVVPEDKIPPQRQLLFPGRQDLQRRQVNARMQDVVSRLGEEEV